MSISPWLQGSRDTMSLTVSPAPSAFNNPSMIISDRTGYAADITGTGQFNVVDLATGSITYAPSAADVGTPGDYLLYVKFYDSTGEIPYVRALGEWLVKPV